MRRIASIASITLLAALTSACASSPALGLAPGALPEAGPVAVRWNDPAQFDELRFSPDKREAARGTWVQDLASHLRRSAERRLAPGQRLDVTIVDIDRAGGYEPWLGIDYQRTRIVRDIYPPRITVQFNLMDADGRSLASGERKLTDPGFLTGAQPINTTDGLRFEKRMIDLWTAREFGPRNATR